MPLTQVQSGMMDSVAQYYSFKNRIINGGMQIDQRNAGASVTASTINTVVYTLDRWSYYCSQASKFTVQQNAASVTPPVGFNTYLGITSSAATSVGASDYFFMRQYIEGFNFADMAWGTANAATVTLSFWVRSSLTGTFSGVLQNSAGNRSYPYTYTINAANTWEQKSVTIAGDTTGTWIGATNGIGASVTFSLGFGSTYTTTAGAWAAGNYGAATGSTNLVSTNGATLYITGVQLEKGVTATSFDYRDYGRELIMCQRYYYKGFYYIYSSPLSTSEYKVTMRATPTVTGGAAGFSIAVGIADRFIASQTTPNTQLIEATAEL
jgi:hypothetical protein